MNSPTVKRIAEKEIEEGREEVVVDLEGCTGMDSTFMGMLAGLSMRLKKLGRRLAIVGSGDQNRNSLEDLGLDELLDIEPAEGPWVGHMSEFRKALHPVNGDGPGKEDHILECHEKLCEADSANLEKFASVLEVLKRNEN